MELIFEVRKVKEGKMGFAVSLLKENAFQWFLSVKNNEVEGKALMSDWVTFKTAITKEFEPCNIEQLLRINLLKLKQTETVQKYIREFRVIVQQIKSITEDDKICYFMNGLRKKYSAELFFGNQRLSMQQ